MKFIFLLALVAFFLFTSCKKEYQCVCTNANTGTVSRGDKIKAGSYDKAANEETCKKNNDLSGGGLKDCHLEDAQ
jgi:hypothetical protein